MLMAECDLSSMEHAEIAFQLMEEYEGDKDQDYPLHYYVDAARDFQDLEEARTFLNKECPLCFDIFPIHEVCVFFLIAERSILFYHKFCLFQMVNMPGCTDSVCKECFQGYFTVVIKEKQVKHFNCPVCKLPDLSDRDVGEFYFELFQALVSNKKE